MKITEVCVKKPVLAWMMMAATIVFGIVAGLRIGISQFPDVDFPTISVNVSWPGAAPEVVENDIVEPLEEALVQVEGLKSISSSSRRAAPRSPWRSTCPGTSTWLSRTSRPRSPRPSAPSPATSIRRRSPSPTPRTSRS